VATIWQGSSFWSCHEERAKCNSSISSFMRAEPLGPKHLLHSPSPKTVTMAIKCQQEF
jgi:hypothetical protein